MRDVRPVLARVLVLALGAAICSLITGLVALYTHGRSLPPSDGVRRALMIQRYQADEVETPAVPTTSTLPIEIIGSE